MAKNSYRNGSVELPKYQAGGLVKETGLAVVHEGEYIMPAPGSEAVIEPAQMMMSNGVVNYHFPVEVHIVGSLCDCELERIEKRIWKSIGEAMNRST